MPILGYFSKNYEKNPGSKGLQCTNEIILKAYERSFKNFRYYYNSIRSAHSLYNYYVCASFISLEYIIAQHTETILFFYRCFCMQSIFALFIMFIFYMGTSRCVLYFIIDNSRTGLDTTFAGLQ